jgi:hypothetical protein
MSDEMGAAKSSVHESHFHENTWDGTFWQALETCASEKHRKTHMKGKKAGAHRTST